MLARQLFYEATRAYKTGDFPMAAEKFKEGLELWKTVMDEFPTYRDDELNKKDTGQIVKRYVRVLKQNLRRRSPTILPFKDYLPLVENDTTVDPFDATRDDRRRRGGQYADAWAAAGGAGLPGSPHRSYRRRPSGQLTK